MPYILVNLVLESFSWILFCVTSAALLSKYPMTNRYLPAQVRRHRGLALVAQGLVVAVLSIIVLLVVARGRSAYIAAQSVFELLFGLALANTVVLIYQFLSARYLPNMPKVGRRILFALCAVVTTSAAAIGALAAAYELFVIR